MPRAEPPHSPQLPDDGPLDDLSPPLSLGHDDLFAEFGATGCDLPDQSARGVTVRTARLAQGDFSGSALDSLSLTDAVLPVGGAEGCVGAIG